MIFHIQGKFQSVTPTMVVVDCQGVGYGLHISLYTFEKIKSLKEGKLFTHLVISEDAHTLFGFFDQAEKTLFMHLISVSGIGPNTARMMLSARSAADIYRIIATGDVGQLKLIKGIGEKTAQRAIVDLQKKFQKDGIPTNEQDGLMSAPAGKHTEALDALAMLGFVRTNAEKVLLKIGPSMPDASVEELIKQALKLL